MTFLRYTLCRASHDWILACEDRPIAAFPSQAAALESARLYLAAAERRGDVAILESCNQKAFAATGARFPSCRAAEGKHRHRPAYA